MKTATPDPKPTRRIRDPRQLGGGRAKTLLGCRVCGAPAEAHHLVPRSLGGDDVPDNIVPLCQTHHGAFERGPDRAAAGRLIRRALTDPELRYIAGRKGQVFLDRYYPA